MATSPRPISDTEFNAEVLHGAGPVLVEYWREGCQPCVLMTPVVAQVAAAMPELPVVTYLVEGRSPTQRLWKRQHLEVTPTLVLYRDGVEVWRHAGVAPAALLRNELRAALRSASGPDLGLAS